MNNYAGKPTKPLDVAHALGMKPTTGGYRSLTGAASAYGLTEGGYNAEVISLTKIGELAVRPLSEGEDIAAMRQAFLEPTLIKEFLTKYDGHQIPREEIALNVIEASGLARERAGDAFKMIVEGARSLGLTKDINGSLFVDLNPQGGFQIETDVKGADDSNDDQVQPDQLGLDQETDQIPESRTEQPVIAPKIEENNRVFITHGKNQDFIAPLKKLLDFGGMEALVSVDKQSVSKPVPDKVMDDMRSCSAAIIHVEDEMRLLDSDANEHVLLNPNVLIEIGAAMALYGRRFILLVKEGVTMPSNLQGLYEVRYNGDTLDGMDTLKLLEAVQQLKAEPKS